MQFTTTILLEGRTATGFVVPPAVVEGLGAGKRPPVVVTVNGYRYRSTVAVMGGRFMVPLAAEHRTAAGLAAGDEVTVELARDDRPREVEVPADLAAALTAEDGARPTFDRLSYSRQRAHVLAVEGARTEATRARRIAAVVSALGGGPA